MNGFDTLQDFAKKLMQSSNVSSVSNIKNFITQYQFCFVQPEGKCI